jgi:Tetracyclin repressor-like, C-terminal domain
MPLTVALVSKVAVAAIDVPDTGTLRGDIRQYLYNGRNYNGRNYNGRNALTRPLARRIVPDMPAEAIRNPELFERAADRGELPRGADLDLSADLLAGALYWRLAVLQLAVDDDYCDRLADRIVAAGTSG